MDVHKPVHLFRNFIIGVLTYQFVHQINREVNNFSRLRVMLDVTLVEFVVNTLKKAQNEFVESRQTAIHSVGVVGAFCP